MWARPFALKCVKFAISTSDLVHASSGAAGMLVIQISAVFWFEPNRVGNGFFDLILGQSFDGQLNIRVKARFQMAVGRQPDFVALPAEFAADGPDQPDPSQTIG
jgi:hypothetical protein